MAPHRNIEAALPRMRSHHQADITLFRHTHNNGWKTTQIGNLAARRVCNFLPLVASAAENAVGRDAFSAAHDTKE